MPLSLSVVVVAYDMARELPRTLTSLSTPYQQEIDAADYEVVVVDNGSPEPLTPRIFDKAPQNWRSLRLDPAPPAPARAANAGIDAAESDFVGLLIDGARMASPGLLARALQARRTRRPTDCRDPGLASRGESSHQCASRWLRSDRRRSAVARHRLGARRLSPFRGEHVRGVFRTRMVRPDRRKQRVVHAQSAVAGTRRHGRELHAAGRRARQP